VDVPASDLTELLEVGTWFEVDVPASDLPAVLEVGTWFEARSMSSKNTNECRVTFYNTKSKHYNYVWYLNEDVINV
jgi:hypothetical protein